MDLGHTGNGDGKVSSGFLKVDFGVIPEACSRSPQDPPSAARGHEDRQPDAAVPPPLPRTRRPLHRPQSLSRAPSPRMSSPAETEKRAAKK